jgi:hypothetical protein
MIDVPDVSDVRVYHRPPASSRLLFRRLVAFQLAMLGFLVLVGVTGLVALYGRRTVADWAPFGILVAAFATLVPWLGRRSVRRLMTYQLTLGQNVLRIACQGIVPIELRRDQITKIEEMRRGLILHYGKRSLIGVPRDLAGYDDVRTRLSDWRPIVPYRFTAISRAGMAAFFIAWTLVMLVPKVPLPIHVVTTLGMVVWYVWAARLVLASAMTPKQKAQFCVVFGVMTLWSAGRLTLVLLAGSGT